MTTDLFALSWPALAALVLAAIVVGFSKTSFGGVGAIAVSLFALVMPAKESTATVLLLLIVGDIIAVTRYRAVSWRLLARLIPGVIPGLLLGTLFMAFVDDTTMRRTIGTLLLLMVLLQLWQRRSRPAEPSTSAPANLWTTGGTGVAAGFTTMTANAAGPVMALYFLAQRIDKLRFIGTNAWFFFLVNVSKVPLAAGLGLFTPQALWFDLALVPAVGLGAWIGTRIIKRVSQRQFETVTLVASALAALALLLR